MFAKRNRLKKTADFKRVFKDGKHAAGDLTEMIFLQNSLDVCRFGFITSLKVSKKATVRNKIRRRLTETVKLFASSIKKGYDIIFIVKPKIVGKTQQDLIKNVEQIFRKTKVYP